MNIKYLLISIFLFCFALFLRHNQLDSPFWVDEFSTAHEAQLLIKHTGKVFSQTTDYFESHNITTHALVAFFFYFFGTNEVVARVPMLLIGSFVPVILFFFAKKIINARVALISSVLYICSYTQITWAQQARGYVLQQFFVLASLFLYQELISRFSKKKLLLFLLVVFLGIATHITYFLVVLSILLHYLFFHREKIKFLLKKPILYIIFLLFTFLIIYSGQVQAILKALSVLLQTHTNNLGYYHSFLWREETIVSFLVFLGVLFILLKQRLYSTFFLLALPIGLDLFFVSFLFSPYVSRYLLPIFPLFFIFFCTCYRLNCIFYFKETRANLWSEYP